MVPDPVLDGRRVESLMQELRRYAPHYTPELDLTDEQGVAPALMRIFALLAENVLVRMGLAPHKHFVAFLASLGISLLPARPARAAVTFKLASGLNDSVPVPAGTRVTAPGDDDEIPFETVKELLAIPGVLTAAYGTDPNTDRIYAPPPGFLDQQIRSPSQLVYEVQSFADAQTDRLQLDHATELGPGSFLRIGGVDEVVVDSIADGRIVTLQKPLVRDVEPQTIVTPIRDFEVFDGIDVQEHAVYLGHADLLTVKEEAEIRVHVTLVQTPGTTLTPLEVQWQIWTKPAGSSQNDKDRWVPLDVVGDGTSGLSASGPVTLHKQAQLEIKEATVGGFKSKWLRAKLMRALPADGRALPEIDTVTIEVACPVDPATSKPKTFPADQGFHNATPLDLKVAANVGFLPFGPEPRQFDQFYIASKEGFSKREARVTLDFQLDLQTLAGPGVVAMTAGPRAYSIGLRRRLYDLDIAKDQWVVLGSPAETPQGAGYLPIDGAVPATITDSGQNAIYTFVATEDSTQADPTQKTSKLWVHYQRSNGDNKTWVDLGTPVNGGIAQRLKLNPAVVLMPLAPGIFARVFMIGGDDELYSRDISTAPAPVGQWNQHGKPTSAGPLGFSPFAAIRGTDVLVFVTTSGGVVYQLAGGTWSALNAGAGFKAVSTPFAQLYGSPTHAKVFVIGDTGGVSTLFECDTPALAPAWSNLGKPPGSIGAGSPTGYLEEPAASSASAEGKHVFVRGADDNLYERHDAGWGTRTRPQDPPLRDSPAIAFSAGAGKTVLNVVSATARNSLVNWRFEIATGLVLGDAQTQTVILNAAKASDVDDFYKNKDIKLDDGVQSVTQKVLSYDGERAVARFVAPPLPFIPDSSFACFDGVDDVGPADNGSKDLFALQPPSTDAAQPLAVRLSGTLVPFNFYSRRTGVLSVAPHPNTNDPFAIYVEVLTSKSEFLAVVDPDTVPELSWEYWNGSGWLSLAISNDGTHNLLTSGEVQFKVPSDIQTAEVAGQNNFWIRARLVGGDYGHETFRIESNKVVSEKSSLRPPKVSTLRISYASPPVLPESCVTFNNLDYVDQTAACQLGGAHFQPLYPLDRLRDRSRILFLSFDKPFKTGPVRLLVDAAERDIDETRPPQFEWLFRRDRRWKPLDAEDETLALTRQGLLSLSASEELTLETRFGKPLYWIAAALRTDLGVPDDEYPNPLLRGIFLNTVWALQGETITGEILGSSDGEESQVVKFQHDGVLDGEEVRVREALTAEEHDQIEREGGKDAIVTRDDLEGDWVRWQETAALFDAGPEDRCYVLDRAAGLLQFGDGTHGRIPPAGVDNIRVFSYRTGGGARGNVPAGKIAALVSAVAGIESVFNPTRAGGGSDKATTEAMLEIGPRRISHRNRAVSVEDFEQLAQEASRQVAKVRCLATTNLERLGIGKPDPCDATQRHEAITAPGWVSIIIVPDSQDAPPCPSLELRRTVKDYLLKRVPGVLASGETIVIRPPDYVPVAIECDIVVTSLDQAATAERRARSTLETFLHPLHGGPDGRGWEFGRPLWRSDVLAALERIDEVDRVEKLVFKFGGQSDPDRVVIGPNELLASGQHVLRIRKA